MGEGKLHLTQAYFMWDVKSEVLEKAGNTVAICNKRRLELIADDNIGK